MCLAITLLNLLPYLPGGDELKWEILYTERLFLYWNRPVEPTNFSSNIRLILSSWDDSVCFHIRGPLHEPFFHFNSILMENWFQCNSVVGHVNAIKFCTCHDSTAVMACAKFDSDHFNTSGMSTVLNFYWIWIVMDLWPTLLCFSPGNSQRPVTGSFDVFFNLRLNKRLSKQWWGWWFETPSRPLWRQCNGHPDILHPLEQHCHHKGCVWMDKQYLYVSHLGYYYWIPYTIKV